MNTAIYIIAGPNMSSYLCSRTLERIPVNEAAPDHASHIVSAWTPDLASVPEEAWQKAVKRFKILKPLLNMGNSSERSLISRRPLVLWVSIPLQSIDG